MSWRGSGVFGDRGELERMRQRLACERLERNCVSGLTSVNLCDDGLPKTPSMTGVGSLMILIDLQMKLFAICRVTSGCERGNNYSQKSAAQLSTKVGLGKAVTRIARALRELDVSSRVATSSSLMLLLMC